MPENDEKAAENGQVDENIELAVNYVKSNYFRVVHADGAWGGLSMSGDIHIAFYNERAAIPDKSKLTVSKQTSQVVIPEEFEATSQHVREVEVDVIVDLNTAISIRSWLDGKIKTLQALVTKAKAQQEKTS